MVKKKTGGLEGGENNAAPAVEENGVSDDLLVEYAKSSRSKCKNCKEQIDKVKTQILLFRFVYDGCNHDNSS